MLTVQLIANCLALGAAYTLAALGFVLILNAVSAVNFAHGDLVVSGGLLAAATASAVPLPGIALLPAIMLAMAFVGLVVAVVAYLPLRRQPPVSVFVSTIAVGIILQNGLLGAFGPEPQSVPAMLPAMLPATGSVAGVSVQQVAVIAAAAVLVAGLWALLERTQIGRRLRASAQDPDMARALGIPVRRMVLLSFALAAALAGAAGVLLGHNFFMEPHQGTDFMLKAYIAVTIGGWGRLSGAVLGAMIIAAFEVLVAAWISYTAGQVALYAALLLVLMVRPHGLMGEVAYRRA